MQSQTVRIVANGVDAGTLSFLEYSKIRKSVRNDRRVMAKQALNYGHVLLNAGSRIVRATPILFFWVVLIFAGLDTNGFASVLSTLPSAVNACVTLGQLAAASAVFGVALEMVFLGKFPGHIDAFQLELHERIARHFKLGKTSDITVIYL